MDLLFPSKPVKWPRPPFVNYPNTQMSSLSLLVQVHSFQNLRSSIYQLQILRKECAVGFNEAQYIVNLVTGGKQDDGWANYSKHETPPKPSTIERICILASPKSRRKYFLLSEHTIACMEQNFKLFQVQHIQHMILVNNSTCTECTKQKQAPKNI